MNLLISSLRLLTKFIPCDYRNEVPFPCWLLTRCHSLYHGLLLSIFKANCMGLNTSHALHLSDFHLLPHSLPLSDRESSLPIRAYVGRFGAPR